MSDWCAIRHADNNTLALPRARWCQTFTCRFRGLMLRWSLPEDEGLLFDFGHESKAATSIHMFFVFFPIAAVWLNAERTVVGAVLARPWRPYYAPAQPARYLIEARPALLDRVAMGDRLVFEDIASG